MYNGKHRNASYLYEARRDRTLSGCCEKTTNVLGSCKFGVRNQGYNGCKQGIRTPNKTYAKALTTATQSLYEFARCKVLEDTR